MGVCHRGDCQSKTKDALSPERILEIALHSPTLLVPRVRTTACELPTILLFRRNVRRIRQKLSSLKVQRPRAQLTAHVAELPIVPPTYVSCVLTAEESRGVRKEPSVARLRREGNWDGDVMKVTPETKSLVAALLLSSPGCSSGIIGAPSAPAEAEPDDDAVSALSAKSQPMQAGFGDPLPRLTQAGLQLFDAGVAQFVEDEGIADGLGPVFNDTSCVRCHSGPAAGGSSTTLETRFGAALVDGGFDPLTKFGGSLMQVKGIGPEGTCDFVGETVPPQANVVAQRRAIPLFGLGLVDAVPETTFQFVAQVEAHSSPGQAGRVAVVYDIALGRNAVGRFGWKDQETSLHQFSGDAYLNEMGITNPEFPDENCPQGDCALLACNPEPGLNDDGSDVKAFTDFMSLLAPPPRAAFDSQAIAGKRVFSSVGCSNCHWATFRAGRDSFAELSDVTFHPYSDFLLHDMGSLGDGIAQADALGSEMRTAPLWGLSAETSFLHDGRATTLSEAILAHDGQGRRARDDFANLSAEDQAALVAFIGSL